jgi:ABC-type antimicrobial peptide transport system permease subunit
MAYSAAQRKLELGIRLALGAQKLALLTLIARRGIGVALLGIATGLLGVLALRRVLASLVAGSIGMNLLLVAGSVAVMVFVALVATLMPAWRAVRLDPMTSMRPE